jgi:hypothetical protein
MIKLSVIGKKFNRLTIIGFSERKNNGKIMVLCLCDCGKEKSIDKSAVLCGHTKSCGCIDALRFGFPPEQHNDNDRNSKEYRAWRHIKGRCYNKNVKEYPRYGGRGITVCDRWRFSYLTFLSDLGRCPHGYSLDRIDNNGNYEPGNCRWTDKYTQANNRRNNFMVSLPEGEVTLSNLARKTGINYGTLKGRLENGWTYPDILSPVQSCKRNKAVKKPSLISF